MKNIGSVDRFLRAVLGASLISWAFNGHPSGWWGLLLLTTAMLEVCPLYVLLGLSTRPQAVK